MDIKEFSLEELHDEMVRRETLEKLKNKPQPIEDPDLTGLRSVLAEYINSIYNGTYHEDSDVDHYIYEEAVKCIYGEEIFDWITKNMQ